MIDESSLWLTRSRHQCCIEPWLDLHCLALPYIALHCIVLPCLAWHSIALHWTAPSCLVSGGRAKRSCLPPTGGKWLSCKRELKNKNNARQKKRNGGTRCSQLQKHLCVVSVPSVAAIFVWSHSCYIYNLAQLEYRSVFTSQNRNVETFLDFQTTQTWEWWGKD